MTAIVDYGVGNLFSLASSFAAIGEQVCVTADAGEILRADRVVLPGVGAFGDAAKKLRDTGLDKAVLEAARQCKPLLGICLGMQLMFDRGYEFGVHEGLGLIPGEVRPISEVISKDLKIPHIGWNALTFPRGRERCPIFKYIDEGDFVYFVHSYQATGCGESIAAYTDYGAPLTAAAAGGNVFACQFHPEKSGETGLKILKAFCETEAVKC